jgi:hypothetical protein
MVICSVRTRPMRSASRPASHPPSAEESSAAVASVPASPALMCHSLRRVGMTNV